MRITYKGDYALKTILDLTLHYGNGVVTIHDLAKQLDIPIKFLEQVLLDLKRGGFVESRRGKIGGYFLAKHPSQIKVGDVVRFIDGSLEPIACVQKKYTACDDLYRCVFRDIWRNVTKAITDIVDNITFEDLACQMQKSQELISYHI